MERYRNSPLVEYAEPNLLVQTHRVPNDSRFPELWGLHNIGQSGGRVDADIDAPEAWDLQTGSPQVVVADIDTGVDYTHADLAGNMWTNPGEIPHNNIDDDGNGFEDDYWGWDFYADGDTPFDYQGHGTHTAGTIGAVGNNAIGVVGVAWRVKIMSLRFLGTDGMGNMADAVEAIVYAANMGAKIANNSWGCGPSYFCYSQALEDAIAYANTRGMLVVASAGNASNDNDVVPVYPCNSAQPNVICVAASDRNDQRAGFSNIGLSSVDLNAPGVDVLSTVPSGGCPLCDASGYRILSGTSMAAPHVSGAAALLLSRYPSLSVAELKALILGSVDPLGGATLTGGRLNVDRALRTNFVIEISPTELILPPGGTGSYTVTVTSRNAFSGQVTLSLETLVPLFSGTFNPETIALPPNGSAVTTLTVSASGGGSAGWYPVRVQGRESSGAVGFGAARLAIGVDLALLEVHGPSEAYRGQLITVSARSVNQGELATPGAALYVTYYLSVDDTMTTGDIKVGGRLLEGLAAGAESLAAVEVVVPGEIPPGTYFLGAIVDGSQRVPDLNRSNNALTAGTITVAPQSDVTPIQEWSYREAFPRFFSAERQEILVVDESGNVYLTQHLPPNNNAGSNVDYSTTKFDSAGNRLWNVKYDSGLDDFSTGMWVDAGGNVYVTGYKSPGVSFGIASGTTSHQPGVYPIVDFQTVKYDANGNLVWVRLYNSGETDIATAISGDSAGNVYVTGVCCDAQFDLATIKYDSSGNALWVRRYANPGSDAVDNLAVDVAGNAYISGSTWNGERYEYTTIKYGANGTEQWVRRSPGFVRDLAVDAGGNVYVTGASSFDAVTGSSTSVDYVTLKYDSAGTPLWLNRYDSGTVDVPQSMDVDAAGNVYVTGSSMGEIDSDYATVKYDAGGRQRWVAKYDGGRDDMAFDIAIDPSGGVYVAGSSADDYLIAKYDPAGNQIWSARTPEGLWPVVVGVDGSQHVYVTGMSKSTPGILPNYLTVKYAQQGFSLAAAVASLGAEPGATVSVGVSVKALGAFAGPVSLSCLPAGAADPSVTCSVSPGSLTVSNGGTALATVTISTTTATPVDRVPMMVRASGAEEIYVVALDLVVGPADPDLVLEALTVAAASAPAGGPLAVTESVLNQGLAAAGTFAVHYRLSGNSVYGDDDDVVIPTTRTIYGLASGVASSLSTVLTLPQTVSPGPYRVCAMADGGAVVIEANEGNNARCSAEIVTIPPADLVVTGVTLSSAVVVPGGLLSVTTTARNQGGSPATAFTVEMHLSEDSNYGGADDLTLTPTRSVTSLAAGVSSSGPTTLVLPETTPFGTYYVCAMADSGQVINEGTFEGNNTACSSAQVSVAADDARMMNISTRAAVGTGSNVAVGGFIISGTGSKQVLLRGFGPTLTSFGIAGALPDPTLDLYWDDDSNPSTPAILVVANNDWGTALSSCPAPVVSCGTPQDLFATGMSADTYAPSNANRALDAALLLTLPPGTYTARLSGVGGSTGVGLIGVDDVDSSQTARLINISTRAFVGTGSSVAVAGLIISGTTPKQILLRGFGPTLSSFGITGALANPTLDLFWDDDSNPSTPAILVLTNNDWGTTTTSCPAPVVACGTPQEIVDTGLSANTYAPTTPSRILDSAMLLVLPPGTYTARLSGVSGGTGVGLIGVDQIGP